MSDFQPLFTPSPDKAEFKPLSVSGEADGFEALDFGIVENESAGIFQPTLGDKAELGSEEKKSAQDEAGAELEPAPQDLDENQDLAGSVATDAEHVALEPESDRDEASSSALAPEDGVQEESSEDPDSAESPAPEGEPAASADAEDGIVGAATVWFAAAVLVEIVASAAFDVKVGCVRARAVRTTRSRASGWLARVQVPS